MRNTTLFAVTFSGLLASPGGSYAAAEKLEKAVFAGGCFWCMVHPFDELPGVKAVVSGYTGGAEAGPDYGNYAEKGHIEAIEITYDPALTSYDALLDVYWRQVDPADAGGQFADRGPQYASGIFYTTPAQKKLAEDSKRRLAASGRFDKPLATPIKKAGVFYPAEEYHQDYYKKNPLRYKFYRFNSGRDRFLEKAWGKPLPAPAMAPAENGTRLYMKPSEEELRKKLTPRQYKVTRKNGTEPAFNNEYWDNHREGIYVDVTSGEPLFSSLDKYDSGTGWPSFTRPLEAANVLETGSRGFFSGGIKVRSRYADSHLGHVFNDGPKPGGLRYCLNSAALRFIPKEDLQKEGYGQYLKLFGKGTPGH